jgi:hypothetical protein
MEKLKWAWAAVLTIHDRAAAIVAAWPGTTFWLLSAAAAHGVIF